MQPTHAVLHFAHLHLVKPKQVLLHRLVCSYQR
ncbi:hypothetical protein VCHENC02_3358A, partial [Vibrio harveyi]